MLDHLTAIPLTILTGFLGSGKTTLLNRILNGNHGLRVAVLVNDFGSINIDAELVVGVESDVISLANGCICCTIRDDLAQTVIETINRPERPNYLLLEASGVADPSGIMLTFTAEFIRDQVRLDSIMCVVDAEQVFAVPEMMELKIRQIAFADLVILNKVDLVEQSHIDRITEWLDERFRRYRLIESCQGNVPLEVLMGAGRFDPVQLESKLHSLEQPDCTHGHCEHDPTDHLQAFTTWSYETDQPLVLESLREALRQLPATVYRAKGVAYVAEALDQPAVLQVVGKRVEISFQNEWGQRRPHTRVVVIGSVNGIEPTSLRQLFDMAVVLDSSNT